MRPTANANLIYSTKDDLQALEADLKLLALTNKDLSHSNKTLTDTIAAISQASISHTVATTMSPPVASLVTDSQATSRAMPITSLLVMPPANLPPTVPRAQSRSNGMTNHLQRCLSSVQELALSISCALDALHGREKTGSSDIHGSYAKLVADVQQLTSNVQCIHCKRRVAWSHLEPIKPGPGQGGACICMRVATPSTWEPCHEQLLPGPDHLNTSTPQREFQIPGHTPPQVGQMLTSNGIGSPIRDDSALSNPMSPSNVMMDPNIRKHSFSELSQVPPPPPQMHMMPPDHQSPQASPYETSPGGMGMEDSGHKVQRMIKRGDPLQANDGKYYCNFTPECADQYFDRKCEWRQVRKDPYLIK